MSLAWFRKFGDTLFWKAVFAVFIKHIVGGVNYALINVVYDSEADWLPEHNRPTFKRPAFQSCMSFFSGFICLLPFLIVDYLSERKTAARAKAETAQYSWKAVSLLVLPSVFDYIAVTISLTCNKWILASVIVVIKGCRVLFSTVLSKKYLGHKFYGYHWAGVALVFPGVVLYGFGNIKGKTWIREQENNLNRKPGPSTLLSIIGMALVFVAEGLRAAKAVYEEKMLKNLRLCPKFIAVVEGVLSTILSVATLIAFHYYPGEEHNTVGDIDPTGKTGSYENFWWTWEFLMKSRRVQLLTLYMVSTIGIITFFGFLVTKYLSAVQNALWGELRIVIVYLTEMTIQLGQGETFFTPFTPLEVGAFFFLIYSGAVFNKKSILPCASLYPQTRKEDMLDDEELEEHAHTIEPETI